MILIYKSAIIFASLAFLFYGYNCLFNKEIQSEFKRFGLNDDQRRGTGILQIVGGFGMAIGYFTATYLLLVAALGLCLLMLIGFAVRLKIKDGLLKSLPSFIFAVITGYIGFITFQNITS